MNVKAFKTWYMIHVNNIISDSKDAPRSIEILETLQKLHVFEHIKEMNSDKSANRTFVLDIVKFALMFLFNISLCGMVFSYEKFAPIITKCFGWVRPMPI